MGMDIGPCNIGIQRKITSGVVNNEAELIRVRFWHNPEGNGSHGGKAQGFEHRRVTA